MIFKFLQHRLELDTGYYLVLVLGLGRFSPFGMNLKPVSKGRVYRYP
jgi:hypothetical protein